MRTEQLLRRLVTAATLVVAALVLMPAGAYAHGGHSHSASPEQVMKPDAVRSVEPQNTDISLVAATEGSALTQDSETAASVLPARFPSSPQTCPGGCCHSSGTGCCAAFLTAPVEIGVPVLGRSRLNLVVFGGAGITPDALPEPPKSLV